eukprot:jgi/Ulvmu1/1792/UM119_0010.1
MGQGSRKKAKLASSERVPGEDRQCGLCGMPQAATEFSIRSTPSPNCRRCERAYNMLHFHERLSMPVVRGNIRALGGPGLLVSTYKREGLKALDLNQTYTQRRNKRSTRSDVTSEGASQSPGKTEKIKEDNPAQELPPPQNDAEPNEPSEAINEEDPGKAKVEEADVKEATNEMAKNPEEAAPEGPTPPQVYHSQEELELLGKHGGIKIIETDLGQRFVYKRKRVQT